MKYLIVIFTLLTATFSWSQIDRSKAPKPQPNPEVNIPKPVELELDNGLKVILVENHNLPKISYQLFIDNPPQPEGNKVGKADIFGDLLGGGTKSTPKNQFNEMIDLMGATFSTNSKGFYASSLTKHSEKLLVLLKSVVMEPLLDKEEFDRIKKQMLSGLEANKADPGSMSANVSNVINYGDSHPYGEVLTEATLANITIEDMVEHYKLNFRPNNAYLVVVGDINPENMSEKVKLMFGDWTKGPLSPETVDYSRTKKLANSQVTFVNKPGAVQSVINITHTMALKPNSEDVLKLSVLNSILGGGSFSARLMSNLREDKAYTYGCYSSIEPDQLVGEFSSGGSFRNEVTDSAIVQILAEIKRITESEITDEELDIVIKSKTGAFARSLESPQTVALFALNTARHNLPEDYYKNYLKNLEAVTKADVLMVAKKYLQPDNINIVVVGNNEIAEKLTRFDGDGAIDFRNGVGEPEVKIEAAPEGVTAQTIIDTYLSKIYMVEGKDAMTKKNAKTNYILTEYEGSLPAMGMAFDMKIANGAPNKSAILMKANGMVMQEEHFNGKTGKRGNMQGTQDYTESEIEAKSVPNFPFDQVYYFKDPSYEVKLLGLDKKDDKSYYKLEVKNPKNQSTSFEYYNTETGLLEMTESITALPNDKTSEVVVKLSDYKAYGKGSRMMLFSEKQSVNNNGMVIEMTLKNATLAKKAPKGTFSGGLK